MKRTLVLNPGHTWIATGAKNEYTGIGEHEINAPLAKKIKAKLPMYNVKIISGEYAGLPTLINLINPELIISMHGNAYNKFVNGREALYYHGSKTSKKMASTILSHFDFMSNNNRGLKPLKPTHRGYKLVKKTKAPCVITELFFIDNYTDLFSFLVQEEKVINAYVEAIIHCMDILEITADLKKRFK